MLVIWRGFGIGVHKFGPGLSNGLFYDSLLSVVGSYRFFFVHDSLCQPVCWIIGELIVLSAWLSRVIVHRADRLTVLIKVTRGI